MWRVLGWLAAITIVLTASISVAETIGYDPDSCATDTGGRVFVRLMNGQSFALPAEDLLGLRGRPGWPDEPYADPDEPVGCPLHPIATQSMTVAYRPVVPPHPAEPGDRRWSPGTIQLITNIDDPGPHRVQDIHLRMFQSNCVNPGSDGSPSRPLVDVSPVLQDCQMKAPDSPVERGWGSYVVARPGTHPEYQGRRFAVTCWPTYWAHDARRCETNYRIEGDLGVFYRFGEAQVPLEHMADFDLQIRAFIAASRTPEYDVTTDSTPRR